MEYLYIDESGSMTSNFCSNNPFFVISIIRVLDKESLKKSIKRFVRKYWNQLQASDRTGKIFNNNKFLELKGSALTMELKKAFVKFLCEKKTFEVLYIVLDNRKIEEHFYKNTARAFNFMIKIALSYFMKKKIIPQKSEIMIQIDERNERPEAKLHLQEYLNTELQLNEKLTQEISVSYFDSCNNSLIQLADFFANLMYSHLNTKNYEEDMKLLTTKSILKKTFNFPIK